LVSGVVASTAVIGVLLSFFLGLWHLEFGRPDLSASQLKRRYVSDGIQVAYLIPLAVFAVLGLGYSLAVRMGLTAEPALIGSAVPVGVDGYLPVLSVGQSALAAVAGTVTLGSGILLAKQGLGSWRRLLMVIAGIAALGTGIDSNGIAEGLARAAMAVGAVAVLAVAARVIRDNVLAYGVMVWVGLLAPTGGILLAQEHSLYQGSGRILLLLALLPAILPLLFKLLGMRRR
jgi:hypothetical protein